MNIFLALIVFFMGLFMVIYPEGWFILTQTWKNYSAAEPSDLYLKVTRISGVICTLAAIAYFVMLLIG